MVKLVACLVEGEGEVVLQPEGAKPVAQVMLLLSLLRVIPLIAAELSSAHPAQRMWGMTQ